MILGGLCGFLIGILAASAQHASGATILFRASIGALVAGVVFRWWGGLWMKSLHEARQRSSESAQSSTAVRAKL